MKNQNNTIVARIIPFSFVNRTYKFKKHQKWKIRKTKRIIIIIIIIIKFIDADIHGTILDDNNTTPILY